jgi:hypothetical protein
MECSYVLKNMRPVTNYLLDSFWFSDCVKKKFCRKNFKLAKSCAMSLEIGVMNHKKNSIQLHANFTWKFVAGHVDLFRHFLAVLAHNFSLGFFVMLHHKRNLNTHPKERKNSLLKNWP